MCCFEFQMVEELQNSSNIKSIYHHKNLVLMGKPELKRPLGRHRRKWEDNIKIDLREVGWVGIDWIDLTQDTDQWRALVNTVINLRAP
jgi:hypothetical protein